MTITKAIQGQPWRPSAALHNATVEIINERKAGDTRGGDGSGAGGRSRSIVRIKNASGSDVGIGGVLGVDGPVFGPDDNAAEFKSNLTLLGGEPAEDDHRGKFVVAIEPIANGAIGRAVDVGTVVCRIIAGDDDLFADIEHESVEHLRGADAGAAVILWLEDTLTPEEPRWGIVRIGAGGGGDNSFDAILGTADLIASDADDRPYRWAYRWAEAQFNAGAWSVKPNGRSSKDDQGQEVNARRAYNRFETSEPKDMENKETIPAQDCTDENAPPIDLPLRRHAVPPNHIVRMHQGVATNGDPYFAFDGPNPLNGCCEEE